MQRADLTPPRPGDVLDGYRLLRKLGDGRRAEVFLGLADGEPQAALKAYRPSTSTSDRAVELEALSRAAHAHVVHVRDVGSDSLILERLELGTLAQLAAARTRFSIGEALTILAPLGSALDAMHASGASHGAIVAGAVHFRATGAPVLAAFGRAGLHDPQLTPAALAEVAGVLADRAAFSRLATTILAPAADERVSRVLDWLTTQESDGFPDDIGEALGERLFEIADAEPVRFDRDEVPVESVPSRAVLAGQVPQATPVTVTRRVGMPGWIDDVINESLDGSPVAALKARLLPHVRGVRRPVWIVAAAVAVALVIALLVVPANEEKPVAPAMAEPTPSESPVVIDDGPISGDEPVAALVALLELRDRCIRELSILCLDGVDQAGSAAMADDVALVRSLQSDENDEAMDAALDTSAAELVERLGDSALVRLGDSAGAGAETQPASLLLMKGEAGWRIRSYLIGD